MLISPFTPAVSMPSPVTPGTTRPTRPDATESGSPSRGADRVELSPEAREAAASTESEALTEDEQQEVERLRQRDQEVRTHEQAHKAAAGSYGGSVSYDYQTGPDGRRYAVGGSVPIDASEVADDPAATIRKMATVRRAALAPADPSDADRQVAAKADQTAARARQELAEAEAADQAEPAAEQDSVFHGATNAYRFPDPAASRTGEAVDLVA